MQPRNLLPRSSPSISIQSAKEVTCNWGDLSGSGQVRIIKPVNVHYFHYLFNASLNIVLEAILDEGDDVTNLDHDAYKYSNDMIKLY